MEGFKKEGKNPNLFTRRWEDAGRKTRDTRKSRTEPSEEERSKESKGPHQEKEYLFLLHWKKERPNVVQMSRGKKEENGQTLSLPYGPRFVTYTVIYWRGSERDALHHLSPLLPRLYGLIPDGPGDY